MGVVLISDFEFPYPSPTQIMGKYGYFAKYPF